MPNINLPQLKKYLLLAIILAIVSILIIFSFFLTNTKSANVSRKTKPAVFPSPTIVSVSDDKIRTTPDIDIESTSSAVFPPQQKIAKVGEEIIYGSDLNYIIKTRFTQDLITTKTPQEVKNRTLAEAIEDSILLQEEKKSGGNLPVSPIYDTPDKNQILRQKIVSEIKDKRLLGQEKISGAFISIWYHNVKPPGIPLADSQKFALGKIQKIYDDIKAGRISFETGGQTVKTDTSLASIDKNYKGNAFYEFKDRTPADGVFVYNDIEEKLWTLNGGDMSEIIQHPSADIPLGKEEEEFYGIIKVTKHTNTGNGSYLDWLKKTKQNYEISIY